MSVRSARAEAITLLHPSAKLASAAGFKRVAKHSVIPNVDGNAVIHGDNLDVLEALVSDFQRQVRCVYIDPPYNNGENFLHYDDKQAHSKWMEHIRLRLPLLRDLLTADGSLWISIDDREVHYMRLMAEEVFGRDNFVTTVIWNHRKSRENRKAFSNNHEYVLCLAKDIKAFKKSRNLLPASNEMLARYNNHDDDPRGPWQSVSANVQDGHATASQFYSIEGPTGKVFNPPRGRCWVYSKAKMNEQIALGNIYFGKKGEGSPRIKKFLSVAKMGMAPQSLWTADEVGTTETAKRHVLSVTCGLDVFDTPKPEQLIDRIIHIATDPGDLVLDAYLGSGTTGAVAIKTGRRFIGIEAGEHAVTHCCSRLRKTCDGERGGVSEAVGWTGGGGFEFFRAV
jgi:adenine-specific DNA-methyltransferase